MARRHETPQQRKMRKIKGYTAMALCGIIFAVCLFFTGKMVGGWLFGNDDTETPSSDSNLTDSESGENSEDIIDESSSGGETSESADSEETPGSQEPQSSETSPVSEKPEQSWSTILVNVWSYMPEDYAVEVRTVAGSDKQFDVRAADALEQMLNDARNAGYNMYLVSAYRTYDYQVGLYNRKVNEYKNAGYDEETAKTEAAKWVAIPGTSEHCLGLAADIVSSTWYNYNSDLTHDFENTEHFDWLYNNCANYGFILRYPKNREATTGITFEPWHYRYVGVEAAKYIMENNITLEEFHAN